MLCAGKLSHSVGEQQAGVLAAVRRPESHFRARR